MTTNRLELLARRVLVAGDGTDPPANTGPDGCPLAAGDGLLVPLFDRLAAMLAGIPHGPEATS